METAHKIKCTRCNEILKPSRVRYLELSNTDGNYYTDVPNGHVSQGSFPFGLDCATSQLTDTMMTRKGVDRSKW